MPLTFAHPAAVLPLMRGPLLPTALVAGALAPDVPYFLRALGIPVSAQSWWEPFLNATTTHSWPGAATVAVPLALVLHLALAACGRPARWALPAVPPRPRGSSRVAWVGVSLVLGVLTHVLWDSFTHGDGWFVQDVAVLQAQAVGSLTWARLLQHLSTALGLVALGAFAWRRRGAWLVAADPVRRARSLRVAAVVLAAAVVGTVAVVLVRHEAGAGTAYLLSSAAVGAGVGAGAATAGLSGLWWVLRPDRSPSRSGRS